MRARRAVFPGNRVRQTGGPSEAHEDRRRALDALAILTGHTAALPWGFPDGLRPDVLRCDLSRSSLFVGDAKEVETPGCLETRVRLLRYIRWVASHVQTGRRTATLAICFGPASQARGWQETLEVLSHEAGMEPILCQHDRLGSGFNVVWLVCGGFQRTRA